MLRALFRKRSAALIGAAALTFHVGDPDRVCEEFEGSEYSATAISDFWETGLRPACALRRLGSVLLQVAPFCACLQVDRIRGRLSDEAVLKQRSVEFRELLTSLGPTAIKFGQMLSIRPDVLPPAAVYELQKLCDSCPAFPTREAIATIEAEFGCPAAELFAGLDESTQPVAAASLGQVYRLRLDAGAGAHAGREVAVKVQRPDMINTVTLDLYCLRKYMEALELVKTAMTALGFLEKRDQFDVALLDTFARASYFELDYVHEAANQRRFSAELESRLGGSVRVPAVFGAQTSRKVLTTEFVEGPQLAQCSPEVINRLIPRGVECFLVQLLETGDFHADPHPGNLLVDGSGNLVLIDFGLCASVALPDTLTMTATIVHLMQGDVGALLEDAIGLGFLPPDVDQERLRPVLEKIFREGKLQLEEAANDRAQGDDQPGVQHSTATTAAAKRERFQEISKALNQVFFDFPFTVPDYFALITRALIVLEGIALKGDPTFDIFEAAYPFALKRALAVFNVQELSELATAASAMHRRK